MKTILIALVTLLTIGCGDAVEIATKPNGLVCGWEFKYHKVLKPNSSNRCYLSNPPDNLAVMPKGTSECEAESITLIFEPGDSIAVFGQVDMLDPTDTASDYEMELIDCPK